MRTIQQLVAEGLLEEALDAMQKAFPAQAREQDMIIQLKGRLSRLTNQANMGLITSENQNLEFNRISHATNNLAKKIVGPVVGQVKEGEPTPRSLMPTEPSTIPIFFSYATKDDKPTVDVPTRLITRLYDELKTAGFEVIRDIEDLHHGESINDFMVRLGKAGLVLVFPSDKYVRSQYCMFELYEIARNAQWDRSIFGKRILPIMVEFVDFTKPSVLEGYFEFWKQEEKEWADFIGKWKDRASNEQFERYQRTKDINFHFGRLTDWVTDLHAKSIAQLTEDNYHMIKETILKRLGELP